MNITDEAHEAASRAAEDAYRRWHATPNRDAYVSGFIAAAAKGAVEAAAPLIAAQALREAAEDSEEEWGLRYRLDGRETEPGYGGHVFGSREEAQQHIVAWRRHFPNLSYTDVWFVHRAVSTGPWEDAGAEGRP